LIRFFMGFETMHAARHEHPAQRLSPSDGIRLVARSGGKRVRRLRATPDEAVNLFLDVDEWLFQGGFRISLEERQSKRRENGRAKWNPPHPHPQLKNEDENEDEDEREGAMRTLPPSPAA